MGLVGCESWKRGHTSFKNVAFQPVIPQTVQIRDSRESGTDDYYVVLVYGVSIYTATVYIFFGDRYRGHDCLEARRGKNQSDSLTATEEERNIRCVENNESRSNLIW